MSLLSTEFLTNFHFLRPLLLLGLVPALLLILLQFYLQQNQSSWSKAIAPQLLPYLLDKSAAAKSRYPLFALLFIWFMSCIALAGPVWQQIPVPVQEKEDALVIVLDMSLSMYSSDLNPSRTIRAQRKLIDVLTMRQEEGLTALVVYAGDAHTVTPFTDDVATISNMVPALAPNIMPVLGSKPADGVSLALELLENSNLTEAQVLLITDGINRSDIRPIQNLLDNQQFTLAILGVGTADGAPIPMEDGGFLRDQQNAIVIPRLQPELLRELASAVNGRYTDIQLNDDDIEYLLNESIFDENGDLIESEREFDSWSESGPWLLLLILPLAALSFRRGWLLSISCLILFAPQKQAYAWEWDELWRNSDQRGNQDFINENYQQAAEEFNSGTWRAAANYRNGSYEDALADLSQQQDLNSRYNLGNTLALLNRFEEAIEAYDQVLNEQPDHQDAIHNREIVAQLQQEQEEQEQEQQQSNSGDNEEQQDQDSDEDQQGEQQQDQQDESEQSGDQQDEQQQQDAEDQEATESEENNEGEQEQEENSENSEGQQPDTEEEQEMQQFLNRIEDNPGELLRNKFRYQYQQRVYRQLQNPSLSEQEAEQKIW